MTKSSKSPKPEFLAERRRNIVELAKRRRQKILARAQGRVLGRTSKAGPGISLQASPPPPQN
jgi:hypothetical protein